MTNKTTDEQAILASKTLSELLESGDVLTVRQAADRLGVTVQAVMKAQKAMRFTDLNIAHARFLLASEVEDVAEAKSSSAT